MATKRSQSQTRSPKLTRKSSASKASAPTKSRSESKTASKKAPNVREETHALDVPETRSATKAEAEFIDNDPGYSSEQLDHMAEYYGTSKNAQTSGDVAEITTTGLAGQKS